MTYETESILSDLGTEHVHYLKVISAVLAILATIHFAIMAYFQAYGVLMLNAAATAIIMASTFHFFRTRKIKTAEIMMSFGSSILVGVYCYKSPENANPSALLILAALQTPLYMPHLNVLWNFAGILVPIAIFIGLQQPGSHNPEFSPLNAETQALINAIMVASCTTFISVAGVFGMRRYIAQRKEQRVRDAQMIQNSKLASLGEMAAGIAHEINNPLTIVEGYAWKILHSLESDPKIDREDLHRSIKVLTNSAKRITAIVSGMRKFSRKASDDPMVPALLGTLIDDAITLCNARIKMHEAVLTIKPSPLLDTEVFTVPVQLTQVLVNLLQNAADATAELPDKNLRAVVIACTEPKPELIAIQVIDSGKGIPRDLAHKIFEPFFTTKPVGLGTGLGLSISKSIMESLGGDLKLTVEHGKTCFMMMIPRNKSTVSI